MVVLKPQNLAKKVIHYIKYLIMSKKYSKDQWRLYQESDVLNLENSLSSGSISASPPKDNSITQQNQEQQFVFERQKEEGNAGEIHDIKEGENEVGQKLNDFTNPVQYEHRDYHEQKHDFEREKVQRELLHEKQLNRKQQLIIEQKDIMISVLQDERRLFENEHKLRNDGLQEKKRDLAAEKQKLEIQSAKIQRERQQKRQELQWQKSNRNTLNIIITEYGQAISSALERYSKSFDRDEANIVLSQLKQQFPSIDKNTLQIDQVNLYLAQGLQSFTNIVIKKHQEKQNYYSYRLREMQKEHKRALAEQAKTHLAKLDQLSSQLLQQQKDLEQKVAESESLTSKLEESQLNYSTIVESSRQQTQQHLYKIGRLTTDLEREKANSRIQLEVISSQSEQRYLQLIQKAEEDIRLLSGQFAVSQTSLEEEIKGLKIQRLETQNIMNELTSSCTSKDESIKVLEENLQSLRLQSQKLQAFKLQNQKMKSDYCELQTKLKQDFAKQIKTMTQQYRTIKESNANNLSDLKLKLQKQHEAQQKLLKGQIDGLKEEIGQWRTKAQNFFDDIQYMEVSFQAKEQARQAYKLEFQVKTAEVIQSIVKDDTNQSQKSRQIFLQTTKDLQDKLTQQCKDKQLLCRNYCKLDEKYNELSKENFLQSLKLQETSQTLLQVQFKEQICIKEITQLRKVLSEIQEMHKNVVEEMQNNFDEKLATTIEETSQFYQVILNSKEKIYETDIQRLHQELQSLRLIKNIKEKISADNQIKLENQRQDLKMKIKAMQREHDSVVKANKNEITTLTESNQFLKKSLELSSETLQAKQRILQSLQNQKALFRKTINFIHNQLDEKSLQQVLEELDRSNDAYNQEVIDMVNGIFFSVSGVSVQNKRLEQEKLQIAQQNEKLGYILKEIKENAEDKDKKLEKIEKIATQTSKFQEKINSLEAELKSARNKSQELSRSLNLAQENAKKSEQELDSIQSSERQRRKDNEMIKAKLEQATKAKNDIQRMQSQKETRLKNQIRDLNQKIDTLTRERSLSNKEIESSMKKEIEQLKSRLHTQNSSLKKLQIEIRELKNGNERLIAEKSTLEKTIENLQKEKRQLEETINRLKNREQEPVRRQVNSPNGRDSQKLIQYEQKASQLEMKNKKLEKDLSEAKNELVQSKKNVKKLLDEINQLKRDLDDEPKSQERKNSWNEQEELVRGYQQMANNAREQNLLLQQQIESLREKLKKSEANNQRSIRSYVSPPKENGLSDNKSPPKKSQIKQEGSEKNEELKKNILFSTTCIMESDYQGSAFIATKIEEIFGNKKKIESTQMLFKYSQSVKTYPFSNFLSKELLQTQCFFIIFASKSAKFAILSYKLQANSRQSALLFSISNKKAINKRGNDNGVYQAVTVESGGDFVVGGGHIRMKPSSKMLAIKDVYRYFEPYDKKEMYGSEYWREDPIVELTEFEIHRVFLK